MIKLSTGFTIYEPIVAVTNVDNVFDAFTIITASGVRHRFERRWHDNLEALHAEVLRACEIQDSSVPASFVQGVGMLSAMKSFSHVESPLLLDFAKQVRRMVLAEIGKMP